MVCGVQGHFPVPAAGAPLVMSSCLVVFPPYSVFCVKLRKSWGGLYCLKKERKKEKPQTYFSFVHSLVLPLHTP